MKQRQRWVVLKFGGTSVSSLEAWETVARVVRERCAEGVRPVVIHSALAGISDLLEETVSRALRAEHELVLLEVEARHERLARSMGLDAGLLLGDPFASLRRLASGVALLGEASVPTRARILAHGELMATRLGSAYLESRGIPARWVDARDVLVSEEPAHRSGRAAFLTADCRSGADAALQEAWSAGAEVVVTQGFIARNSRGETVLLGRGGSDASGAYFASRLEAERLEIWTDVPGMFSADPRVVPSARLLKSLSFDEAQEIATTGSKVLHPRAIPAIRAQGIPIHIRSTPEPKLSGTVIAPARHVGVGGVKAISRKQRVTLVSMESLAMWQEVGFLARAFEVFRRWGLSVDLVSTSESMVTVSLDRAANVLTGDVLEGLTRDLGEFSQVTVVENAAALSLVGRQIRGMLHRLGPVFELFQEERVHLVSQAASDLNLTFVVDGEHSDRLVARLHALLIRSSEDDPVFGPTWSSLTAPPAEVAVPAAS